MARAGVPVGIALTIGAALAGCSGPADAVDRGVPPTTTTATSESRVIAPGSPGEPAETIEPGEPLEITDGGYSEHDVRFIERMIPHHRQALEMAALAPDRASDERVRVIADNIAVGQQAEIGVLEAWLEQRGLPVPPESATGERSHTDMPGMLTPLQMQLLQDASEAEFDRLFLTYMSNHHAGAVEMADAMTESADIFAAETAADIRVTQSAEINRMQEVLDDL